MDKYTITNNYQLQGDLLKLIKEQPSVSYDFNNNTWVLPLSTYKEVLLQVKQQVEKKNIQVCEIPQLVFELIIDNTIPFSQPSLKPLIRYNYSNDTLPQKKLRVSALPSSLLKRLYTFQKVGIQFGLDHFGRILLGDEMGVGKTVQAIGLSYLYQRDWPVLVICPSSLKYAWRDELLMWLGPRDDGSGGLGDLGQIRSSQIQVISKENEEFLVPEVTYFIISYSLAWKMSELIAKLAFQIVIVDEAHYLKSRESKRSQHLLPIIMRAKRVLLLSGTPMLGRPNEIYNLLKILRPDAFRSFKEFGMRYCNPKDTIFGVDWAGCSNMRELHLLLEKCLMIRRLKQEVLFELPAKRRQKIVVTIDDRSMRKIGKYLKQVKKWETQIEEDFAALDNIDSLQ